MTSVLTSGDFRARTSEELRARLLALVLTAVLVWYTLVVPPYAPAPRRAVLPSDDEGADGEIRHARVPRAGARAATENADAPNADAAVEDLEWPEYIGLD